MSQPATLSQVYDLTNLRRAWRWILTSREAQYKNYFRHAYRAYALAAEANLASLRSRLRSGAYQPEHAAKIYHPKRSGGLRPLSLLTVEDQIVYQAFGSVIAERLARRVSQRYERQVFGHLYAGKTSFTFYRDWRRGYRAFTSAFRSAYARGLAHTASFDLTACYDSIDHTVLTYFLTRLGVSKEVSSVLGALLSKWTAASDHGPIYHGHGIPQGPQPSGLLAECVLQHLDGIRLGFGEAYLRYVDDIRLLAKTERAVRKRVILLDLASKEIGLFPQTSKIEIHVITDVDSEIRGVSHPPELGTPARPATQTAIRRRLVALTRHHRVNDHDETRLRFVLARATQWASLSKRLIRVLQTQPHLFPSVATYLSTATRLSAHVSRSLIRLMKSHNLYPAFTSGLLRAARHRLHPQHVPSLISVARSGLKRGDVELREAAGSVLLTTGALTWAQTKYHTLKSRSWYVRGGLARFLDPARIGDPSHEWLLNELLRDTVADVALVAADMLLQSGARVRQPVSTINRAAQVVLKRADLIGRVSRATLVADMLAEALGPQMKQINWRTVLGKRYALALRKLAQWNGYLRADPTAWVNLTDTINDIMLACVFDHQAGAIGRYNPGDVGSVLQPRSRFARCYPLLYDAVASVHSKRLESDLAHALLRRTGKPTRRIEYRELKPLLGKLKGGYVELWQAW